MLDVRRLRVLQEVAAAGSVSAAAANLGYTHSAISQQLRTLERETATRLIDRRGRTVRLTRAAQVLVAHAKIVLAQLERAEADLAATRGTVGGQVRLASFATATSALLPAPLMALRAQHPNLDLRLLEMEPQESLPALAQGHLDIVLAHRYDLVAPDDAAELHQIDLFTEPVLLVQAASSDALPGPVRLSDYAERPWIVPHPDTTCGLLVERACAAAGFTPHAVAQIRDFPTACALAAAGIGVTLVPELGLQHDPRIIARPVTEPSVCRRVYLATRPGSQTHPTLAAVLACIQAHAADRRPPPATAVT
jgi:DNA-binding transcriptional LysR family regulator